MKIGFTIELNLPNELTDQEFNKRVGEIRDALLETARDFDLDGATIEVT
jgi:hypothetical protein